MGKKFSREDLRPLVEAIEQGLRESLWGIVLFGSAARGEAESLSDVDILLIADGLPERFMTRIQCLRSMVPENMKGRVSFIARTKAEFEGGFPSYYLDIGLDGTILYDREEYIHKRLERIRQLIQIAGLTRRPIGHGFVWEWKKRPSRHWRIDWSGVYGL